LRIGIPSDQRVSKELSSNPAWKLARDLGAKKRLIATIANSEIESTFGKQAPYRNPNRNKNGISGVAPKAKEIGGMPRFWRRKILRFAQNDAARSTGRVSRGV
jgi:hypothetical protein